MRLPCKTKIEKVWLVTSLTTLFLYRMQETSSLPYESADTMVRLWLEVAMVVLSFPLGGFTIFAIQDATFWCDGCENLKWMLDWPTMLLAGYIQWFWLLPEILRDRKLTFLNLRQPVEAALPDASTATVTTTVLQAAPAVTASDSCTRPLAEFDEAGLTALGRVLQPHSAQHAPTPRPAPRAELIFPEAQ